MTREGIWTVAERVLARPDWRGVFPEDAQLLARFAQDATGAFERIDFVWGRTRSKMRERIRAAFVMSTGRKHGSPRRGVSTSSDWSGRRE